MIIFYISKCFHWLNWFLFAAYLREYILLSLSFLLKHTLELLMSWIIKLIFYACVILCLPKCLKYLHFWFVLCFKTASWNFFCLNLIIIFALLCYYRWWWHIFVHKYAHFFHSKGRELLIWLVLIIFLDLRTKAFLFSLLWIKRLWKSMWSGAV